MSDQAAQDVARLVQSMRDGNAEGFEVLVKRYFGTLYLIGYGCLGNRESAEELAQESLLRAFLYLDSLNDNSRFVPWLVRIARNLAYEWQRRDQRHSRLVTLVPIELVPEAILADSEDSQGWKKMQATEEERILHDAIQSLPEQQRELILLHYVEELSQTEIGERLGIHPTTVGRQIRRALKSMKVNLEPILRGVGRSLRASDKKIGSTTLLLATVAGLSSKARADLITAAGGAEWASGISVPKTIVGAAFPKIVITVVASVLFVAAVIALSATAAKIVQHHRDRQRALANASHSVLSVGAKEPSSKPSAQSKPTDARGGDASSITTIADGERFKAMDARLHLSATSQPKKEDDSEFFQEFQVKTVWRDTHSAAEATTVGVYARTPNYKTITDKYGLATMRIPKDWHNIQIFVSNPDGLGNIVAVALPAEQPYVIQVVRGSIVYGTVRDLSGKPVARATIRVDPPVAYVKTTSNIDGSYELHRMPERSIPIYAFTDDLTSYKKRSEITQFVVPELGKRFGPCDLTLMQGSSLYGTVMDKDTRAPIAGAKITASAGREIIKTTDSMGNYRLQGLPQERGYIQVQAPGYMRASEDFELAEGEFQKNIEMAPGAELEVTVVDEQQKVLSEVEVFYFGASETTNALGKVLLSGLPRQDIPITASRTGYEQVEPVTASIPEGVTRSTATVVMRKAKAAEEETQLGYFTGTVTDEDGKALSSCQVIWSPSDETQNKYATAATDTQGKYSLEVKDLDRGFVLSALISGKAPQSHGVRPGTKDKPTKVDFVLGEAHWLKGVVVDDQGQTLSDVWLTVSDKNGVVVPGQPRWWTTSYDGRFDLKNLPGPEVKLSLKLTNYSPYEQTVKVDQEIQAVLTSPGAIRGQVIDKDSHKPIPQFQVNGKQFNSNEGRFQLDSIQKGEKNTLSVTADHYEGAEQEATVNSDPSAPELVFELAPAQPLFGIVIDENKAPIAKATVRYVVPSSQGGILDRLLSGGQNQQSVSEQRVITGADGSFTFWEGANKGIISAEAPGYAMQLVKPNERMRYSLPDKRLSIPLSPQSSLACTCAINGSALSGQVIVIPSDSSLSDFQKAAHTDASGLAKFTSLSAGDYIVRLVAENPSMLAEQKISLRKNENKEIRLPSKMGSLTLSGTVTCEGSPVRDATISLSPLFSCDVRLMQTAALNDGAYRFANLLPGRYQVSAESPGLQKQGFGGVRTAIDISSSRMHSIVFAKNPQ